MELNPAAIARQITQMAAQSKTEEDLKIRVSVLLNSLKEELGIESEAEYEKMVYKSRRADAVYPAIVIEYKKPGKLRNQATKEEAIGELQDYLVGIAKGKTVPRKYVGIAIDGENILFVRAHAATEKISESSRTAQVTLFGQVVEEHPSWEIKGPMPINEASVELLILYFRGLALRNLSADNLANDFGSKSDAGKKAIRTFYARLVRTKSPKTKILFDEWKRLFGIVYGEELARAKKDLRYIITEYELEGNVGLQEILFTIHTYFAFLMKLIAGEILSLRVGSLISSLVKEVSTMSGEQLKVKLLDLEEGGLFKRLGIKNYMEGDFFSWYLNEWDDEIAQVIRHIGQKLSMYEPVSTVLEPDEARDLLKKLYQYLIPKSIRHDLGEYYTPDWLADLVLKEVGYDGNPDRRILDPACGSGTFLVLILSKILGRLRDYPEDFDKASVMKAILSNVVGFDINPIAVLAARTNFIIAVSDLRKSSGIAEMEIPVYLADSVLVPRKYMTATGEDEYNVSTSGGVFHIPAILAKKETLGKVLGVLEETVEVEASFETFKKRLEKELSNEILEISNRGLKQLFSLLKRLDKEKRDKIWTRIIKNNFAPIYVEKFDYVVGNPPWINWQNLSKEYRDATEELWWHYGLFQHRGFAARLGGAKVDFSMLFTYASLDNYLTSKGRLGFVITQTVFKTKGVGGEHFRRFRLTKDGAEVEPIRVDSVQDLVSVKPFKGVANRTAVLMLTKGEKTEYPVNYYVWARKTKANIPPDATYEFALNSLRKTEKQAIPIDQKSSLSPWLTCIGEAASPLQKMLGKSGYKAHEGVNTLGANGIYWLNILEKRTDGNLLVENIPEMSDVEIKKVEAVIEHDFVYPLLTGRAVSRWKINPAKHILMMHDPEERKGYDEKRISIDYPKTYAFLKKFEKELTARPIFQKFFCDKRTDAHGKERISLKAPFYTMYGVGEYTFSPYKVVWKEQSSTMVCAIVDEGRDGQIMPDHKLMFVPFHNKEAAYYCGALLSSTPCRVAVKSYVVSTSTSTHIFDYINIPEFELNNSVHRELAKYAQEASRLASEGQETALKRVEEKIDVCACEIWQINDSEFEALKKELAS